MQTPKYSFSQDSFFIKPDSRALVIALLLTLIHGPCYFKCHYYNIFYYFQPQILAIYYLFAFSL